MVTHPEILRDLKAVKAKLASVETELAAVRENQRSPLSDCLSIRDLAKAVGRSTAAIRKAHKKGKPYPVHGERWFPTFIGVHLYYRKQVAPDAAPERDQ